MDVAVCFLGDETQGEVEKRGERSDGRDSSKSQMVAGGSLGEMTHPCLAGCFVERGGEKKKFYMTGKDHEKEEETPRNTSQINDLIA